MKPGDIVCISLRGFQAGMIVDFCKHTVDVYNVLVGTGETMLINKCWLNVVCK